MGTSHQDSGILAALQNGLSAHMIDLFMKDVCPDEATKLSLMRMLHPVACDLQAVHEHLKETLTDTRDPSVREIVGFLLESPGKRIRPALALLSARAACVTSSGSSGLRRASMSVAAAVELIHMASLVHDDLIDGAAVRHNRSSVHVKWGKRISVAVGDHLCAKAFQLVADCADPQLFAILGSPLSAMCEGEIQQVVGRGDFSLSEHHCLGVTEKKTAALFGACCAAGAATATHEAKTCKILQKFGFHFGVAFQVLDDCKDLLSDREGLGKTPGQDLLAGDVTLPLLYAIRYSCLWGNESVEVGRHTLGKRELAHIGQAFRSSQAPEKVAQLVESHVSLAKQALESIADSDFKDSLRQLADHIAASASYILAR